ncbi:sugar ABC transporter permease [Clostridia bacterium]|nr:sugar ABC transporter permease [Clostridia bacterium]
MGLSNFRYIMSLPRFANALRNTIVIGLLKLLINYPAPILFAIFLNEVKKPLFKRINQTISYLPHFISWVVAAGMWYRMLSPSSGVINQVLLMLGIIKNPINFVGEPDAFYPILLITDLWKELGWSAIIYLAAITSISPELYEAARVDGANRLQQTLYITLPGIQPTMILMLVLAVSNLLNVGFDQIYNMTNIVVLEVGEVLDTLILRMLTVGSVRDLSLGTAMGLLKNTIALALFLIANGSSRILFKESLL